MDLFRRRPPVWALILLPVLLWLGQYWQRGLWEPDEARYAYVAREMRESGEWLVMHINGRLYPDKPPLLFWLTNVASGFTAGEVNGVSARLPSLLGMILALWAIARLAERWADAATAWRTVLVTMTAFLVWQEGGWGRIDALLLGLEMAALYHFFTYNDDGRAWRPAAAYGLLGLALLAKGPVALPVTLGIYAAGTLAAGEGAKLRRWHWVWGLLLAVAPTAAWLAAARWLAQGPDEYFDRMIGQKLFHRVTKDVAHPRPFHYYLKHFPSEFLPWTIFLPATFLALGPGVLRRRLLAWAGFVFILFSLFSGKRQIYILGLYPAVALLVAAGWPRLGVISRRWSLITGGLGVGLVLAIGIAGCAAVGLLHAVPAETALGMKLARATADLGGASVGWRLLPTGVLMLAGGVWLLRTLRREQLSGRWFAGFAAVNFANLILVGTLVLPAMNPVKAPLALVPEAQAQLADAQPIHLYQQQLAIVPFYVERPGRELRDIGELEALLQREPSGIVVFLAKAWAQLPPEVRTRLTPHPLRIGGKRLVWAEFPASGEASREPLEPLDGATARDKPDRNESADEDE